METDKPRFLLHLLLQTLACALFILLVLWCLNKVSMSRVVWAVGASSIASSAFSVFMRPESPGSHHRCIIIAYLIATGLAEVFRAAYENLVSAYPVMLTQGIPWVWLFAVVSMVLSILLMVWFKSEHPPAVGVGLVLMLEVKQFTIVIVLLAAAIVLALARRLLRSILISL